MRMSTLLPDTKLKQDPSAAANGLGKPDFNMARRFLTLLGEGEDWTFQTFDDTGNHNKALARIFHSRGGEISGELLQSLAALNQQGAGIFATVNRTDRQGRKASNIIAVRTVFVDLDGPALSVLDTTPLPPHTIVESSPHRYHAYWILDGLPLAQFSAVQESLAARFGGDPTVKDLPRVMRLPGFYHRKGNPFLTHIVLEEVTQPYNAAAFLKAFAIQPAQAQPARLRLHAETPPKIAEGSRNTHLASVAGTVRRRGMSNSTVEAALREENRANCDPPLSAEEVQSIAQSICRYPPGNPNTNDTFNPESLKYLDGESVVQKLAALNPLTYDMHRKAVAKQLGVRPQVLDKEIEKCRRKKTNPSALQGTEIQFATVEPWQEPVNGTALLDDLIAMIRRFIVVEERDAQCAALWILATYYADRADCAPILAITSPEKRCGKSTLLRILSELVARPLISANITQATTFRVIEKYRPTLLIDEADTFLKENDELRGILNSGHIRATAFVLRSVGDEHEPRSFSTFGFKAIACIGSLSPTLADRSIEIRLRRRRPNEPVQKLRDAVPAEWESLRSRCARFVQDTIMQFPDAQPTIPPELNDRAADNWIPLLKVAELAGGSSPSRARQAALTLSKDLDDQSASTRLLADIQAIFDGKSTQELTTHDLLEGLYLLEEGDWDTCNRGKPLSARQLGSRLRTYGIASVKLRPPGGTPGTRGYRREDFEDAWNRYLAATPSASAPQAAIRAASRADSPATLDDSVADETSTKPSNDMSCGTVADESPPL